ncbi:MAG: CoA-binding protein [Anaerolineae bacterium]
MSTALAEKVEDFLSQQRIAVAGVSRNPESGAAGNLIYRRMRAAGYTVFAVNPNAEQVEGDVCYHDVKAIPGSVDGVIIVTRADATDQIVHDCAEAGIRRVWMHHGMHGAGSSVSATAVSYCQDHQISVIDGACPLMFGKPSDGGHRLMRFFLRLSGDLPK